MNHSNIDKKTVNSFGDEWSRFDQISLNEVESKKIFNEYFSIFPFSILNSQSEGFDMGCGSGRWARYVAPHVGKLNCIDPSSSIEVARNCLIEHLNINYIKASVDETGLTPSSQDFGYSLGVLHHVPDTVAAIRSCVNLLKPGAPLLLYLYYSLDNRPLWYKFIWYMTNLLRRIICIMPSNIKGMLTDIIAVLVYFPLAKLSKSLEKLYLPVHFIPLSYYRNHSFYTMRTDSRDRFGTPLEKRFSKKKIAEIMNNCGLINLYFSENAPYWCVVGFKNHVK